MHQLSFQKLNFAESNDMETFNDNPFSKNLVEGVDFYYNEDGYKVFTEAYHLKRGYCCQNVCKHCPYGIHDKLKKNKDK